MSDLHKLTGAYAVDALDDIERARFEQHLAGCEDCRAEVAELRETASLLTDSVSATPPASLRASVLAGISQVRPLPPEVTVAAPTNISSTRAHRRRPVWTTFLVAAALIVVAGVGVSAWSPWSTEVPRLTAAEQVLQAPDAEEVFVDLGDAGQATVVRSKSEDRAVIRTEGMASAPDGKAFELWFITDDEFTSAGLMPNEADQTVVLDGSAAEAAAVGITVEPEGGSDKPTTEPIALFDLTETT
ncbi:anti-sigma factor [Nocardioides zhouii]|uniref:Regulator of SigK n=1 Tax=Nocardioides zhouii TaxID=1168729 RepID=A0A4Q2SYY1_9ACTN|nr:anti-sigma factor [Nocardioides zhouii]RYC11516.1 anti-sigma factor [Nocardioides zhouii]